MSEDLITLSRQKHSRCTHLVLFTKLDISGIIYYPWISAVASKDVSVVNHTVSVVNHGLGC